MRIIGGRHRGRKLAEFGGEEIRPTADRVKESLFNILSFKIAGATVLDLFCGSGNLGLECLSRGAASAHFNDFSKESLLVLKKNIASLKVERECEITNSDYLFCLANTNKTYDLIFIAPPYAKEYGVQALKIIVGRGLLNVGGVAVYERDRAFTGEVAGLEMYDERRYGKTYLSFFKVTENV